MFHSFLQVFKIENLDSDVKPIFFAANTLLELMQLEAAVMCAASMIKPAEIEAKFNSMVDSAVADYKTFLQKAFDGGDSDLFKVTTMSNFKSLFDICIDIRKKEQTEEQTLIAADEQSQNLAITGEPSGEKSAKIQRRR